MPVFADTKKLIDEINELPGKNKKAHLADVDALGTFFKNYYGGKESLSKRSDILEIKIRDILADPDDFNYCVIAGIRSYPNDKYKLTCRLEHFFKHLKTRFGLPYSKDLFSNFNYRDKSEKLLKMLKYLHSGDKSRAQIAEDFGIRERSLADDLNILIDGFEFMDSRMQIAELKRKKNSYSSLIHPIFLAMNSSEIYALTVGLKLLSEGTVFQDSLSSIADKVYKQLSGHAKDMVDQHTDEQRISFEEEELKFINTAELFQRRDINFTYFLKEPVLCKVTYLENGKRSTLQGILKLADEKGELKFDRVIVETDGAKQEVEINYVIKINKVV